MRPRRVPFAVEYIEETVRCYERAFSNECSKAVVDHSELQWAADVLEDYFQAMPEDENFIRLKDRVDQVSRMVECPREALMNGNGFGSKRFVPYLRDLSRPPSVNYDALLALAWRRRSVRWFLPDRIPRALIDKAITVAGLSPSACNRQPFIFRIIDEPELLNKVVNIPMGMSGYGHNVPAVAVIVGRQRNYFDERDRHLIYIDGSLAAMAFVFALESLGLSSCCVNWPDIEERERCMSDLLKLAPDERPVMLVAFGYADRDGLVAYSQKKPLHQLRRYNMEESKI